MNKTDEKLKIITNIMHFTGIHQHNIHFCTCTLIWHKTYHLMFTVLKPLWCKPAISSSISSNSSSQPSTSFSRAGGWGNQQGQGVKSIKRTGAETKWVRGKPTVTNETNCYKGGNQTNRSRGWNQPGHGVKPTRQKVKPNRQGVKPIVIGVEATGCSG